MTDRGDGGKFVTVRNGHPPNHHHDQNGVYHELVQELTLSSSTRDRDRLPIVDLVEVYCPHGGGDEENHHVSAEELAGRVLRAIESGKSGTVEVTSGGFLTLLAR